MRTDDAGFVLSERKKQILKAIIDVHIRLGEPVGSKFLQQNQQIALSGATIRNEMAELEEMGYLEQPHTSAGRIPSHAGYRLYVDKLMNRTPMQERDEELLEKRSPYGTPEDVLSRSALLLTELTGYTAVVMRAGEQVATVKRFDMVPVDPLHAILVMTAEGDNIKSKNVTFPHEAEPEQLKHLTGVFNTYLAGHTMEEINLGVMVAMETELGDDAWLLSASVKSVYEVLLSKDKASVRFEGISKLLQYPEFSDMARVRDMMELLEDKDEMSALLSSGNCDRVNIVIGGETSLKSLSDVTLVFRGIRKNGKLAAVCGVIGPCRMDYSRVISLVDAVVERTAQLLGTEGKGALPPPEC